MNVSKVRGAVVRNTVYFAPAANVQNHWPHRSVVSEAQGPLRAVFAPSAKISQRGFVAHFLLFATSRKESAAEGITDVFRIGVPECLSSIVRPFLLPAGCEPPSS